MYSRSTRPVEIAVAAGTQSVSGLFVFKSQLSQFENTTGPIHVTAAAWQMFQTFAFTKPKTSGPDWAIVWDTPKLV